MKLHTNRIFMHLTIMIITIVAAMNLWSFKSFATDSGMSITAIYMKSDQNTDEEELNGGDATLVESDGEYLLMDCGADTKAEAILKYLHGQNVKSISIYISHLHPDHFGGLKAILNSDIKVEQVYVPYVGIDPNYKYDGLYYSDYMKKVITTPVREAGTELIGLFQSPGSMLDPAATSASGNMTYEDLVDNYASIFTLGDAVIRILGPFSNDITLASFDEANYGSLEEHYLNNRSLVAQISDGNRTFLTAGDMEKLQENELLEKYGSEKSSKLNADIFKLSRHGLDTSNGTAWLKAVSPTWTFGPNSAQSGQRSTLSSKGVPIRKTYNARNNASKYGFTYMVGDNMQNLTIESTSDGVSLYRGSDKLQGLVEIAGNYGTIMKTDFYYINKNGKPSTGIKEVNGKLYNFGNGGCAVRGTVSNEENKSSYGVAVEVKGNTYYYNPVVTTNGKKRYYSDYESAVLATGFKKLKSKYLYYFSPKDGYSVVGDCEDGQYAVVQIKETDHAYAIKNTGVIRSSTGKVKILGKNYAYVGEKNHYALENGWINSYYYGTTSYLRCGSPVKLKSVKYATSSGGNVITWSEAAKASGYYIYRSESYGSGYKRIKTVKDVETVSYTDKKAEAGKAYFYKVRSYLTVTIDENSTNTAGEYTSVKSVLDCAVEDFKLTAKTGKVKVTWTKAEGADGYKIYQKTSDGYKLVATLKKGTSESKTISDLTSGNSYTFKMRAYKTVDSKTVYGPYTSTKKVTVK